MHLCLSGNPSCSVLSPCVPCFDLVKARILPRAMVHAGGPFTDPEWSMLFIETFIAAWRGTFQEIGPALAERMRQVQAQEQASREVMREQATEAPTLNAQEETELRESTKLKIEAAEEKAAEKMTLPDGTPMFEVEDQDGEGYAVSPERMAEYMRVMQKKDDPGAEAASEEVPKASEGPSPTVDGRSGVVDTPIAPAGGPGQAGTSSTGSQVEPVPGPRVNGEAATASPPPSQDPPAEGATPSH